MRKQRINVTLIERQVLENIIAGEPDGKKIFQIAKDIGKNRSKVTQYCKRLEKKNLIFKENKQASYHITKKIYGYPGLTGFLFGKEAIDLLI